MFYYIVITSDFANAMKDKRSTINNDSYFGYAVTNDGRYVCSYNSLLDFLPDFEPLLPLSVIALTSNDFPITPLIT